MNLFNPDKRQNSTSNIDSSVIVSIFKKQAKKGLTSVSSVSDITRDQRVFKKEMRTSNIHEETMQV